jgi:FkbM family methyltransferase
MSALRTSSKLFSLARQGSSLKDCCLAFLCAGLGVIGRHRRNTRRFFLWAIKLFARSGQICLHFRVSGKPLVINMRCGNEADYLVVGELIMGGYEMPVGKTIVPAAILDCGANIGVFALQAYARFPQLPIKCYEPDAANVEQLKLNLANNGIKAVVESKAVWSETAQFFFHPGASYTGFVSREKSAWPISCELPKVLDNCWLKLDVEGAEYEVLPALLRNGPNPVLISMEIHDFARRGQVLMDLLNRHGYGIEGSFKADAPCVNVVAYLRAEWPPNPG